MLAGRAALVGCLALAAAACATPETTGAAPATASAPAAAAQASEAASQVRLQPLKTDRSEPVSLSVPSIGVRSRLMELGLQPDGSLEVPPGGFPAGWFTGAPTPGELGPAVIAGHVHWVDGPGVFWRLGRIRKGEDISIVREDGSVVGFVVTSVQRFPKDRFPTARVYGDIDHAGLRLITCGGYDEGSRSYEANIVVFAELTSVTHK